MQALFESAWVKMMIPCDVITISVMLSPLFYYRGRSCRLTYIKTTRRVTSGDMAGKIFASKNSPKIPAVIPSEGNIPTCISTERQQNFPRLQSSQKFVSYRHNRGAYNQLSKGALVQRCNIGEKTTHHSKIN